MKNTFLLKFLTHINFFFFAQNLGFVVKKSLQKQNNKNIYQTKMQNHSATNQSTIILKNIKKKSVDVCFTLNHQPLSKE